MFARIVSLLLLTQGVLITLLRRVAMRSDDALGRFEDNYGSEGILSVRIAEAKTLEQVSRCVACGRCDAREGPRISKSTHGYRGMMAFALRAMRSLVDYDATSLTIEEVPELAFEQAQRLCPLGVPLLAYAQLVRRHAARMMEPEGKGRSTGS
jgi:succinate dehydrogenase/fumarate reductase-like Fe-S protein